MHFSTLSHGSATVKKHYSTWDNFVVHGVNDPLIPPPHVWHPKSPSHYIEEISSVMNVSNMVVVSLSKQHVVTYS